MYIHAGNPRMPPRVLASGPKPCGGNYYYYYCYHYHHYLQSRIWILSIGFSLAFGAMFIKTWRVYKLFTNKQFKVHVSTVLVIKSTHYKNSFLVSD